MKSELRMAQPNPVTAHGSPLTPHAAKPWWREPWPWLLMAGPFAVLVAGSATIWLAVTTSDGLVAGDYYKRGLAINRTLERERHAAELGLTARAGLSDEGRLGITLAGGAGERPVLRVALVHPTQAGLDRRLEVAPGVSGAYEAWLQPRPRGRWLVTLEDAAGTWRLGGSWDLQESGRVELVPRVR
jgi:uncharacterized protein